MTLYEIDQAITECIDLETGEIDTAALEALQMEREKKIESIACWIKDLIAEAKALKEEADKLTVRRKSAENKVESLKNYLGTALDGEKFKTAKAAVNYRSSAAVEIDDKDLFVCWATDHHPDLLTVKDPEPNKTAIKEAIENGEDVRYARIQEKVNVIIK